MQAQEKEYDLESNLAVLKLYESKYFLYSSSNLCNFVVVFYVLDHFNSRYQFNPNLFQTNVAAQILLKALTNLPHTDFILCKCLIDSARVSKNIQIHSQNYPGIYHILSFT